MNLAVQCPDISGIDLMLAQFDHLVNREIHQPGLSQRSGIRRFNLLVAQLDDLLDSKIGQSSFAKLDKVNWVNLVLTQLDNLLNVEVCYPRVAELDEVIRFNPVLTQLDDLLKSERRHSLSRCAPLELSDWFPPTFVLLPTLAGPPLRLGKRLLAKNFQQLIGLVYSDLTCDQHC